MPTPASTLHIHHITRCLETTVDDVAAAVVDLARSRRNHGQVQGDAHDRVINWTACHAATALEMLTMAITVSTPNRHEPLYHIVTRIDALRRLWKKLGGDRW